VWQVDLIGPLVAGLIAIGVDDHVAHAEDSAEDPFDGENTGPGAQLRAVS